MDTDQQTITSGSRLVSTLPPLHGEPGELPSHASETVHQLNPLDVVETLAHRLWHMGLATFHTDVMGALNHQLLRLEAIQRTLAGDQSQDWETTEYIAAAPYQLNYQGRRHLLAWSAAAVTGLTMTAQGATRTLALSAGWNVLDPPRGSTLSYPGGGTVQLILRATDHVAPQYA